MRSRTAGVRILIFGNPDDLASQCIMSILVMIYPLLYAHSKLRKGFGPKTRNKANLEWSDNILSYSTRSHFTYIPSDVDCSGDLEQ